MRYKNNGGQSREDCMKISYVLANEFKAPQKGLAAIFGCSQGTISAWNKEATYKARIYALETELEKSQKMQCTDTMEAINNHQYEQHIRYLEEEHDISGVNDIYAMDDIDEKQYEQHIKYLHNENK
uniref:hypothetical protein n=1 Tax=Psychrobacter sp. TaxID=56811 RepID=UPI00159B0473|nr:hypothetical protein [Psychrobacter sp.]QJS05228.1 hypothetical protein [Psychrobacter sp.]